MRIIAWVLCVGLILAVPVIAVFQISPWPSVLLIRYFFDEDGKAKSLGLEKEVPPGITGTSNEQYDASDPDAHLDSFYPSGAAGVLPVIVWTHGGAWVSGGKSEKGAMGRSWRRGIGRSTPSSLRPRAA